MSQFLIAVVAVIMLAGVFPLCAQTKTGEAGDRLAVVWASGDPEVAHKVCLMYTHNAKTREWFKEVILIVWGPSARLLAADKDLQEKVTKMAADGIKLQACKACSDSYGVSERLEQLGVEVTYMGQPLTSMLRDHWTVLTF